MNTLNYKDRKTEMIQLRRVMGKTLQEIANKYKISRERVRQIIGNTGKEFRQEWTRTKINSGAYDLQQYEDIQKLPGIKSIWAKEWGKHRHAAKSGYLKTGQEFEEMASKILFQNNIKNDLMPIRHPYDIKTSDDIKIDVKSSSFDVSKLDSQRNVYPTYPISNLKNGKDCDFFFIFVPDKSEVDEYTYFIIPSWEVYDLSKHGSRIRIPWPKMGRMTSKWHKYHKRIDLILHKTGI